MTLRTLTPFRLLSCERGEVMTVHLGAQIDAYQVLRNDPGHWDRQIAADLAAEMKAISGDRSSDIPEIRRFLAVKGYRDLKAHLADAVQMAGSPLLTGYCFDHNKRAALLVSFDRECRVPVQRAVRM